MKFLDKHGATIETSDVPVPVTQASDLGLPPGNWRDVILTDENKTRAYKATVMFERDGDVAWVLYIANDGALLIVEND